MTLTTLNKLILCFITNPTFLRLIEPLLVFVSFDVAGNAVFDNI